MSAHAGSSSKLRTSSQPVSICSYSENYNFIAHLVAPTGTKVPVDQPREQWDTFLFHGVHCFILRRSIDYYFCHMYYIPTMGRLRMVMILAWFPHTISLPKVTTDEYLCQLVLYLVHIQRRRTSKPTSLKFKTWILNLYLQVADIFQQATTPPDIPLSKNNNNNNNKKKKSNSINLQPLIQRGHTLTETKVGTVGRTKGGYQ